MMGSPQIVHAALASSRTIPGLEKYFRSFSSCFLSRDCDRFHGDRHPPREDGTCPFLLDVDKIVDLAVPTFRLLDCSL